MRLSILVPVFNEENTILNILEEIKAQNFDTFEYEIIVINDWSTEKTYVMLKNNPDLYNNLVYLEVNSKRRSCN